MCQFSQWDENSFTACLKSGNPIELPVNTHTHTRKQRKRRQSKKKVLVLQEQMIEMRTSAIQI